MARSRLLGASALLSILHALVLLVVIGGVKAQITSNVTCMPQSQAFFNSRGQTPCLVAAYLGGQCNGGQYDVSALGPNQHYIGPTPAIADACQCNTVMYSVMAACSTCQNASVITWTSWSESCPEVYKQIYPRTIPSNTAVPGWAYEDVTITDSFNPQAALSDNSPESTNANNQLTQTSRPTATNTSSSNSGGGGGGGSNTGAIVGGVIGGIAGLAIIAGLAFFFVRRQKEKAKRAGGTQLLNGGGSVHGSGNGSGESPYMQQSGALGITGMGIAPAPMAPMGTGVTGQTTGLGSYEPVPYSPTPVSGYTPVGMRPYDPNDPTTYPISPSSPPPPSSFQNQFTGSSGIPPQMPTPMSQHQQLYTPAQPGGVYRGAPEV